MRFLSVCSGIEAASVAWSRPRASFGEFWNPIQGRALDWHALAFAEIEAFPCAVLAHHYPDIPNLGDITRFYEWPDADFDVLAGGTPCQSFSVAGLRAGLADPRGNLALTFLAIAARYRPRWILWENVPGVFSSTSHSAPDQHPPRDEMACGSERVVEDRYDADEVHAFACFLAGLSELRYGWAYRVLDAQHFGVPQRRKRVYVVASARGWAAAAAVFFERESLRGDLAPSREARENVAGTLGAGLGRRRGVGLHAEQLVGAVSAKWAKGTGGPAGDECYNLVAGTLHGHQRGQTSAVHVPVLADPICANEQRTYTHEGRGNFRTRNVLAFDTTQITHPENRSRPDDRSPQLAASSHPPTLVAAAAVRRLTPRECERLNGFPDDYTLVPFRGRPAKDGPRYRAIGNSWAVPKIRWLGERIELVEDVLRTEFAA